MPLTATTLTLSCYGAQAQLGPSSVVGSLSSNFTTVSSRLRNVVCH